jgi:hypothetical protein
LAQQRKTKPGLFRLVESMNGVAYFLQAALTIPDAIAIALLLFSLVMIFILLRRRR